MDFKQYLNEEELKIAKGAVNTDPSDDQIKSGKYKKAAATLHGIKIKIENPKGSTRSGSDPDGNEWSTTFKNHYGYIDNTVSNDGDGLDVFIGDNIESEKVFVVNQTDVVTDKFDEVKIILGCFDLKAAEQLYLDHYETGWNHYKNVVETDADGLKEWIKSGDTTKEFK